MKVFVNECDGSFGINIEAETKEEAAILVRLGMNARREVLLMDTDVYQSGTFSTFIVFPKHRRANSHVPRRK